MSGQELIDWGFVDDDADVQRIAVVGAGPAGLSFSTTAATRGHDVTLFDQADVIGGQFNMAKVVPGKEEFHETLRYFAKKLKLSGVRMQLGQRVSADDLAAAGFDKVVLATGVLPRDLRIPGSDHPKVLSYIDVLKHQAPVGKRVAVIGAGGIGFDVAEFLTHEGKSPSLDTGLFAKEWGIDPSNSVRGGVAGVTPELPPLARDVFLLQRKTTKHGQDLGKTTGWIHRLSLKHRAVTMLGGVTYDKVDDAGLHYTDKKGAKHVLDVDHVVVCAGQVPLRELEAPLQSQGVTVFRIGGAEEAGELDAKRAIDQGARLAAQIETATPGVSLGAKLTLSSQIFQFAQKLSSRK